MYYKMASHFEKETYLIVKVKNLYNMAFGVKGNSLKVRAIELKIQEIFKYLNFNIAKKLRPHAKILLNYFDVASSYRSASMTVVIRDTVDAFLAS